MEGAPLETAPERIPSRQEVMDIISFFAEGGTVVRELSDEQGLYLLEVKVEGENPGETIQYEYMRKGKFPNHNQTLETTIHRVCYENGTPVGGTEVAVYRSEATGWEEIK